MTASFGEFLLATLATLVVGIGIGIRIGRSAGSASTNPRNRWGTQHEQDAREALEAKEAQETQRRLGLAVEHDQLVLHYQPKVELGTGRVAGLEALLRWQHPERGLLLPAEFLPAAALSAELIRSLTTWVLRRALADYTAWTASGHNWTVSVNISGHDLGASGFPGHVAQILQDAGVRPDRLHLEVNETELARDIALARQVVGALAALGIQLSIDDFGNASATASELRTFAVSEVKIDRMFVASLPGQEHDRARVSSLIELGHGLGCLVTAEGVEWQEVADWLAEAGCDHAQGYLWLRPRAWPEVAQVFGTAAMPWD